MTERHPYAVAADALTAAGLTRSEAIDVIRGARSLPGPLTANIAPALDVMAATAARNAVHYDRAATFIRQAGTNPADLLQVAA